MVNFKTTFILGISLLVSNMAVSSERIFSQASKGSFNDAAITKLFESRPELKSEIIFSGTPEDTFHQAVNNNALAFSAVQNSTLDGRLVPATVNAFQLYKLVEVKAYITTPIEMCVLMNQKDNKKGIAISQIASHPAALKQINRWKNSLVPVPKEIEVPNGTAEAARRVANNEYSAGTAAIGSCALKNVYPNLVVIDKGVQDNKDNKTTFMLMKVEPRESKISYEAARKALASAIEQGIKLSVNSIPEPQV
ncbi:prephenate dehydratase [Vibrio sp. S4M6]|uniref:prephenate dehydratase domain-containing protein n=1 Tax=Vibrio sinus TaxID=2946865 RepID=UPI00202A4FFB|nr:prephenate dehydratase domain-containing protein [Vibrio sinus]MCL9780708.1 prephenate dehydratase [Vibrio sinus]